MNSRNSASYRGSRERGENVQPAGTMFNASGAKCCFPAFWFIFLILGVVIGTFFIYVNKKVREEQASP